MGSSVASAKSQRSKNGFLSRLKTAFSSVSRREYKRVSTTSLRGVPALIIIIALGMTLFGCVMVLSASSVEMIAQQQGAFAQASRQAVFGLFGIIAMFVLIFVPIKLYRNKPMLYSGLILMTLLQIAVLVLGKTVNGNRNWLVLGGIQIQPSEFSKIIAILWIALILKNQGDISVGYKRAFFPVVLGLAPLLFLILAGGDVGTILVYGALILMMIWVGGLNRKVTIGVGLISVLLAVAAMMSSANRRARVLAIFGYCQDSVCDQSNSGLAALASGGFWGVGLGQSRQKYNYLPEAHNDYIFAVIGEELGLVGTLLVILFYIGLIYCAVRIITRSADRFIQLATTGILTWLVFQALINIMMVTGLAPVIGVPLPFISYGGSSLISSLMAAGLLVAFARQTPLQSIAGGTGAVITDRPHTKDLARRASLSAIVNAENEQFRQNGWKPSFDIDNYRNVFAFFGFGAKQSSEPAPREDAPPRRRVRSAGLSSQASSQRPTIRKPRNSTKLKPLSEDSLAQFVPAPAEETTAVENGSVPSTPTFKVLSNVEETDKAQVHAEPEENIVQVPVEPAPRKLPPGLVPIRQARKARENRLQNPKK